MVAAVDDDIMQERAGRELARTVLARRPGRVRSSRPMAWSASDCMAAPQHDFQRHAHVARRSSHLGTRWSSALLAGMGRLQLGVPAHWRLARFVLKVKLRKWTEAWIGSRARGRRRRALARGLILSFVASASVACGIVSGVSEGEPLVGASSPALSKPSLAPTARRPGAPFSYVLPVDHGVRADPSGQGHFRAPRFHGEHNGVDLLAPVGTPLRAPCSGKSMSGVSQSFGHWVHLVCPAPEQFSREGAPHPWVSFFFAHLEASDRPLFEWTSVQRATQIGTVGKSGNARGEDVRPHVHLEFIVQHNRRAAMDERHLGKDQSNVEAAEHFARVLKDDCLDRWGFEPKSRQLQRARRIDPFIVLSCLSDSKPNYEPAPSPLEQASRDWTHFYTATEFNVNLGLEDAIVASR